MGGNFGYPCSPPGLIKCFSIVVGFLASGIVWATIYKEGTYSQWVQKHGNTCVSTKKETCPDTDYLVSAASTTFVMFIVSLIVMIIFLFAELQKNSMFNLIDFVGHIVGGLILIVMGILCIVYIFQGYAVLDCGSEDNPEIKKKCEENRSQVFPILSIAGSAGMVLLDGTLYLAAGIAVNRQKN